MIAKPTAEPEICDRITSILVDRFQPLRVALYGSRARGDARDDSDYDVMVVVDQDREGLDSDMWNAVSRLRPRVSIVVRSAAQYDEDRDDVGALVYVVEREGRTLYEREARPASKRVREPRSGPPRSLALWLRRADNDFRNIERALGDPDPPWDTICFHAHQGVEKLLKSVLIAAGAAPPYKHELTELLDICPVAIAENRSLRKACALLSDLYGLSRYGHVREPKPREGRQAVEAARTARDILMRHIPIQPTN